MIINETITHIRANTSINWPDNILINDPNDPVNLAVANGACITSLSISEDGLTKERIREWNDRDAFIAYAVYHNANASQIIAETLAVSGLTRVRTVEVI